MFIKYRNPDLGLLIVRLGFGATFFMEGYHKLATVAMTTVFFAKIGFPAWMVYFVAAIELIAGIVSILGVLPEWGYVIAIEMAVVLIKIQGHKGLLGFYGDLMLLVIALLFALSGYGRYALQRPKSPQTLV